MSIMSNGMWTVFLSMVRGGIDAFLEQLVAKRKVQLYLGCFHIYKGVGGCIDERMDKWMISITWIGKNN